MATMRVLVLAEACNPEWSSLPSIGYRYARALGDVVDAVVVTNERNRPAIERHGLGSATADYVDTHRVTRVTDGLSRLLRGGEDRAWTVRTALDYPAYLAFERAAWKRYRVALRAGEFDLVHRITPASPAVPSPMAAWSPVPFVLGPLNGGLAWPQEFAAARSQEREWLTHLRNVYKRLPYARSTMARSSAILAAFAHTVADLPPSTHERVIDFPEVGLDPGLFHTGSPRPGDGEGPLTVVYAGRLVPLKLVDVLVLAFAGSDALRRHRLVVCGEGPERAHLEALVAEHGLGSCVELRGHVPQHELGRLMGAADILGFPSIKDFGGGAVVEAMACGLAPVVVEYGGPGGLVDESRGITVAMGPHDVLVTRFREALEGLVADPARTRRLGEAAARYAMGSFTWAAKAAVTADVYQWVLGQRPDKPRFGVTPDSP
jgi:glycosyltransferase involved in cell wall biosynthesis